MDSETIVAGLANWGALGALVTVLVGTLKAAKKDWIKGKESAIALLAPAAIAAGMKFAGWGFVAEVEWWPGFVIGAMGASIASGLVHDKVVNPMKDLLKILKWVAEAKKKKGRTGL